MKQGMKRLRGAREEYSWGARKKFSTGVFGARDCACAEEKFTTEDTEGTEGGGENWAARGVRVRRSDVFSFCVFSVSSVFSVVSSSVSVRLVGAVGVRKMAGL